MSQNKPTTLKDFDATKLSLNTTTMKDIYGGQRFAFKYDNKKGPITIRIEAPIFTYGVNHIKDYVNKEMNTGKFQMACLPYKKGGISPDVNTPSEMLFYNNFEKAILDKVCDLVLENKAKFGFTSKLYNNDFIKSTIKDIIWRKKDKKNEDGKTISEKGNTSYLYLKLRSKNIRDVKSASFSDIITPFFTKKGDKINSFELSGKSYNLYADIIIYGLYQKQKASNVILQFGLKGGNLEEIEQNYDDYSREFQ